MNLYEPLVEGLDRAAARLEKSRLSRDPRESFIAISECLLWVMALDDRFNRPPRGAYEGARQADEHGRAIPGMRHAWNVLKHSQLSELVDVVDGAAWPVQWPATWVELVWKPFTALPVIDRPSRRQEASYMAELERRPVRLTVHGAVKFVRRAALADGA